MSLMVTRKPLQYDPVRPCLRQDPVAGLAVGLLVHLLQSGGVFTLGFFLCRCLGSDNFLSMLHCYNFKTKNARQGPMQRPCWKGTGLARKPAPHGLQLM